MTEDEKDQAWFESLFDEALEQKIVAEEWWHTPEGLADIAQQEAEIEVHLKEMEAVDAEIAAYLKEIMND